MRYWFLVDSLLVLLTGIQLFVLTEYTDRFFAWTITPALTAAFLGAAYWAALPLVYLSSRETIWARARLAVFGVLVFTILTTAATLIHLDRFHLFGPNPLAQFAAWVWLAVYGVVPPALLIILILQTRLPGSDPRRQAPLPGWLRAILALQALVMLTIGVILFIAPLAPIWPWKLTPLTGRAVGAWLVGIGIIVAHVNFENDWRRVHITMISYTLFAVLELLALVRYLMLVDWSALPAMVYLVFLLSVLVVGGYGWLVSRAYGRPQPMIEA
jgi:hypothetical protein